MEPDDGGSVTRAFRRLNEGDTNAMQQIWERYFSLLVALARRRLQNQRRLIVADEEDAALSAFMSFHRRTRRGDFPDIHDRDDLWVKLVGLTAQKVIDLQRRQGAAKRGANKIEHDPDIDQLIGKSPDPEFIASWTEEVRVKLDQLGDETLREIAVMKMGCHTNEEIAQRFNMSLSWTNRRLREIRRLWEGPNTPEEEAP
ncbi:ECF-type sigma factor [Singulisphaera sp. PoT]|uniref:ECF-type sigma factor n=1 Tax=Singulisphaera sp. PoT TaxID=3411797 RepID=UPI003BF49FF9